MANENELMNSTEEFGKTETLNFDELEEKLQSQLDEELTDLDFLKEEKDKIGNPDNLGNIIKDVVWEQFINQIASKAGEDFIKENHGLKLDLRYSAHIQTAENFADGKIATHNHISRDQLEQNYDRYKNTPHSEFRDKYVDPGMNATLPRAGKLKEQGIDTITDIYTGRQIPTETKLEDGKNNPKAAQREHVKSSAELYQNPSLQMAYTNEELADIINNPENLQGYTTAERNNRKSDNSSDEMSEQDKTKHWEDANERAKEYINKKEQEGEERLKKEGRKTQKEEAFRIGGKALRAVVMKLLAEFVKEIISKLVKWFKSTGKKLESLLGSLKEAITSFVGKLKTHLIGAADTLATTIATAIVGPIIGTIKKVWTFLKQGWKSLKDAIAYIKNPENKEKPIGILLMEVGKIVMAGLSAASAIVLGELIEKALITIPGVGAFFAFDIPLLGSLANILGIFFGAVVAGIIGAIAINLLDKAIAKQKKAEKTKAQIDKGNEILDTQAELINVKKKKAKKTMNDSLSSMNERHVKAGAIIKEVATSIINNGDKNNNQDDFDEMNDILDNLLN